ncbi:glycosyltransferase family 49 protein [Infundibulicybe gibba]|nr:glycosyltransferase family 49 protein [Infundibulicybe gibba]
MDQSLFISKAFSNSLRPTKIIPYYYRASGVIEQDDITITTLITRNRFPVFFRLVERYQGPISVTIHVKNDPQNIRNLLTALDGLYASSKFMSMYVDVHLVVDPFDRQFNLWRNVARFFARTDFVMMLDIDFAVCTDFRSVIRADTSIMGKLREGNTAYVVPAFEYADHREGVDEEIFPKEKQVLLSLVHTNRVGMFHSSWAFGHGSTDYEKYYNASPGTIYKVVNYQSAYEPYVVFKKDGPPWCDERFIGYGGNKAACLFEMYLSGISYYVLADHFIIHQSHLYEEVARKNERKSNRRVYADFKEETCLR